jgi:hypothetical protein
MTPFAARVKKQAGPAEAVLAPVIEYMMKEGAETVKVVL